MCREKFYATNTHSTANSIYFSGVNTSFRKYFFSFLVRIQRINLVKDNRSQLESMTINQLFCAWCDVGSVLTYSVCKGLSVQSITER